MTRHTSARHPANGAIIDHLRARLETVETASNFRYTLRRAIASLVSAAQPIRSRADARKLPYVGEYLATEIELFLYNKDAVTPQALAVTAATQRLSAREEAADETDEGEESRRQTRQMASGALVMDSGDEEDAMPACAQTRTDRSREAFENGREQERQGGRGIGRGIGRRGGLGRSGASSRSARRYVPQFRSGGFAVLISLLLGKRQDAERMLKAEICETAQPYCDERMESRGNDNSNSWYGGWNSTATLVDKGLVMRKLRGAQPALYWLSTEGESLAEELWAKHKEAQQRTADGFVGTPESAGGALMAERVGSGECANRKPGRKRARAVHKRTTAEKNGVGIREMMLGMPSLSGPDTYIMGPEYGAPGDAVDRELVDCDQRETFRKDGGRLRFNDALVKRSANVIEKLERDSESREDCLLVLGSLYEGRAIPRTEDGLFEAMSSRLWQKRVSDSYKRRRRTPIGIQLPGANIACKRSMDRPGEHCSLQRDDRNSKLPRKGTDSANIGTATCSPSVKEARINQAPDHGVCSGKETIEQRSSQGDCQAAQTPPFSRTEIPVLQGHSSQRKSDENTTVIIDLDADDEDDYGAGARANLSVCVNGQQREKPCTAHVEANDAALPRVCDSHAKISSSVVAAAEDVHIIDDDDLSDIVAGGDSSAPAMSRLNQSDRVDPAHPLETTRNATKTVPNGIAEGDVLDQVSPNGNRRTCQLLLILDSMERTTQRKSDVVHTMSELLVSDGVRNEVRGLPCGDALFIAKFPGGTEVVLDYLIERKTLNDFAGSLHDGRVARQSYMMRQSLIEKLVFVLEGQMNDYPCCQSNEGLSRKLAELEICDDFYIKHTKDLMDTMWFYASIFRRLKDLFEGLPLFSVLKGRCLFPDWAKRMQGLKSELTLDQLFMLQLCQFKGVGKESAAALLRTGYNTPQAVFRALDSEPDLERREKLFTSRSDSLNPRVSRIIQDMFTEPDYGTELVTAPATVQS